MACSCCVSVARAIVCVFAIYLSQSNENEMTFFFRCRRHPRRVTICYYCCGLWLFSSSLLDARALQSLSLLCSHLNYIVLKSNSSIPPSTIYAQMEKEKICCEFHMRECVMLTAIHQRKRTPSTTTDYRHDNIRNAKELILRAQDTEPRFDESERATTYLEYATGSRVRRNKMWNIYMRVLGCIQIAGIFVCTWQASTNPTTQDKYKICSSNVVDVKRDSTFSVTLMKFRAFLGILVLQHKQHYSSCTSLRNSLRENN